MHQLSFISTARPGAAPIDVEAILASSRRNNARDSITGLLIYDGKRFLQELEGSGPLVEAAFSRIKNDTRHRATVMLSFREVDDREFGAWDMACQKVEAVSGDGSFGDMVDNLVDQVPDANTKALLSSFVRIKR
ncbi:MULTISPECIES: BLUF domain-containing protein [unclassified Sphingomonas]|uniref:BLUF domain-containing protein n=1 Tax=unclassified Sphingomonas TaxID=196159 RepID=UPI001F56E7D7|nr:MULTISPECIES: BLUF domain-containing protein [unclassified Sphingomonas]